MGVGAAVTLKRRQGVGLPGAWVVAARWSRSLGQGAEGRGCKQVERRGGGAGGGLVSWAERKGRRDLGFAQ